MSQEQFTTREGVQEFFDILYEQLLRHLDNFVKESRGRKLAPGHFAAETAKGLRFLGIVSSQYDVVATNPPYLSGRKMNKRLADLLKDQYPEGKSDLYAAFILRCQELARQNGFVGMLTMHSFMFISSYENMRDTLAGIRLRGNPGAFRRWSVCRGESRHLADSGPRLEKGTGPQKRQEHRGTYFRLVREKDSEAKRIAFEEGLAALEEPVRPHPLVFTCRQEDFDAIPGKPWVYWMPQKVQNLFDRSKYS